MIQIFKHRCNDLASLTTCEKHWGVEIDLRSDVHDPSDLHLSHDPWRRGESFARWLKEFVKLGIQGPIILNTKEDGLEGLTLELLENNGVSRYIFLDTALPTLRRWTWERKNKNFFIRSSAVEPVEFVMAHRGHCEWVWIDCFDRVPPSPELVRQLSQEFKTCLVSPELQGGTAQDIDRFRSLLDAGLTGVCTKFPLAWA